jgi:hypothetical protein
MGRCCTPERPEILLDGHRQPASALPGGPLSFGGPTPRLQEHAVQHRSTAAAPTKTVHADHKSRTRPVKQARPSGLIDFASRGSGVQVPSAPHPQLHGYNPAIPGPQVLSSLATGRDVTELSLTRGDSHEHEAVQSGTDRPPRRSSRGPEVHLPHHAGPIDQALRRRDAGAP